MRSIKRTSTNWFRLFIRFPKKIVAVNVLVHTIPHSGKGALCVWRNKNNCLIFYWASHTHAQTDPLSSPFRLAFIVFPTICIYAEFIWFCQAALKSSATTIIIMLWLWSDGGMCTARWPVYARVAVRVCEYEWERDNHFQFMAFRLLWLKCLVFIFIPQMWCQRVRWGRWIIGILLVDLWTQWKIKWSILRSMCWAAISLNLCGRLLQ